MRWMKEKWKEETGLTLIEILVSIFILSLVIVSASAAFIHSTKTSGDQQIRLTAMNLANERMEHIRSLEFADIGTRRLTHYGTYIAGNPAGLILQEETKVVNGVQYLIETSIAWEEQAAWTLSRSAEWDYKIARITVTPIGYESGSRLAQSLESYITRDWAQPALKGYHIQFRAVEGWRLPDESPKPIYGIHALMETGPGAPSLVQTTSKGVGSFLELSPGNFRIILDSSSTGYMMLPGKSNVWDVVLGTETTIRDEFEFAKPCGITFTLKLLSGDLITPEQISEGSLGKITINAPYPIGGAIIEKTVHRTDVNVAGKISRTLFGDLWPVGEGYSGSYGINHVSLDGYQYIGYYIKQGGMETPWDGRFVNQGTLQDIILYFTKAPVMPGDIDTNWSDNSGVIPGGSHYAEDNEGNTKSAAKFSTDDVTKTLVAHEGTIGHYNSLKIYIENIGTSSSPGLLVKKNSEINLRTGEIVLRGKTILEDGSGNSGGKIVLHTTWQNNYDASYYQGDQIRDEKAIGSIAYGKIYLSAPVFLGSEKILSEGGYYFPNGAVLPDDANVLIPFSKENYIE